MINFLIGLIETIIYFTIEKFGYYAVGLGRSGNYGHVIRIAYNNVMFVETNYFK